MSVRKWWTIGLSRCLIPAQQRTITRRLLGVLFSFAVDRKYVLQVPLSKQSKSSVKRGKPGILTVEQCVRLLSASAFPRLMTKFSQQSRSECLQVFAPSQKSGDWIGVR